MKVLITGGRDFCEAETTDGKPRDREIYMSERRALGFALDFVNPTSLVVGDATGADRWAKIWCERRSIPFKTYYADWKKHLKRAGPIRNQTMVDGGPDYAVVFPGGRGTKDCHERVKSAGIDCYEVRLN